MSTDRLIAVESTVESTGFDHLEHQKVVWILKLSYMINQWDNVGTDKSGINWRWSLGEVPLYMYHVYMHYRVLVFTCIIHCVHATVYLDFFFTRFDRLGCCWAGAEADAESAFTGSTESAALPAEVSAGGGAGLVPTGLSVTGAGWLPEGGDVWYCKETRTERVLG